MHICIDSSVFIREIPILDSTLDIVINSINPLLTLAIPRLIAIEVTRNLETLQQTRQFYRIFDSSYMLAQIIDELIPPTLVVKYSNLGLPAKADAFIGAFAEWQGVDHLLSYNRHFLRQLRNPAFEVSTPNEFAQRFLA